MKLRSIIIVYIFSVSISACKGLNNKQRLKRHHTVDILNANDTVETFKGDATALTSDFDRWYKYTHYNIRLAQDFIGLSVKGDTLDKPDFLNQLATGNFIPVKTHPGNAPTYHLYKNTSSDGGLKNAVTQMAQNEIRNDEQEGTKFPDFYFTDLNDITYNKSNTRGKIIVIKCWFVGCIPCMKEFPRCNELVNSYRSRKDVLFISLTLDSKESLSSYLKANPLYYAVIPDAKEYMVKGLKIGVYPTHLLINREGTIIKVTNSIDDLIPFLEKEVGR